MIILQVIDIPQICSQLGVRYVVISPGSRSAHITMAFARHPDIQKLVVPDERSAAYIALGLAQACAGIVALVCTSGSATVNYYPAITEAYYQNVPLLVLTADRPAKWIDKNDGQTIRQENLYKNHIKSFYLFPEGKGPEIRMKSRDMMINAINDACKFPQGPVHVNIPIDEPFYPELNEEMVFEELSIAQLKKDQKGPELFSAEDLDLLKGKKVAIVAGQMPGLPHYLEKIAKLSYEKKIPVFADVISNVHSFHGAITFHDSFEDVFEQRLVPEVIITFGKSILSKRLKLALRNMKELIHFHVSLNDFPADTYLSLKKTFHCDPMVFFEQLLHSSISNQIDYFENLVILNQKAEEKINRFPQKIGYSEFQVFSLVWNALPDNCTVHLANSMPVRYANIMTNKGGKTIYANRGTSGIDGSTSTAVGHSIHNKGTHFLLTGDMAFFYDRNALWHSHLPDNLKIVVFNNHGGGIFRLLEGPDRQPELESYFETNQKLTAKNTAIDFEMDYYFCDSEEALMKNLPKFLFESDKKAILEIETLNKANQKVFLQYKSFIKNET